MWHLGGLGSAQNIPHLLLLDVYSLPLIQTGVGFLYQLLPGGLLGLLGVLTGLINLVFFN